MAAKANLIRKMIDDRLRREQGCCLCDACIARESNQTPRDILLAAAKLSTGFDPKFTRYRGKCDECGEAATVTSACENMSWA